MLHLQKIENLPVAVIGAYLASTPSADVPSRLVIHWVAQKVGKLQVRKYILTNLHGRRF